MTIFEKALKTLKIVKFCGEIRTKDGTFLIADGEFDVGVTLSVQTSEGIKPLPDGTYTLDDGRIIQVVKSKIKEIVEPLVNEPGPNPLETPPWIADGAIGLVGGQGGTMGKQNFQDDTATVDNTQAGVPDATKTAPVETGDTTSDVKVPTIEELNTLIQTIQQTIADLTDRVAKLEGETTTTVQDQKLMKEQFTKINDFYSKNTPVSKTVTVLDGDDEQDVTVNTKILQVLQAQKTKNKK